jgi:hypothetical protein
MKALVDNDVILKGARYGLLDELIGNIPPMDGVVGILGSAKYVLTDLLQRRSEPVESAGALARVLAFIDDNEVLEPTIEEQALAAEFESCAQMANLPFDTGESLLCSILVIRVCPLLITGDKRAIISMEQISDSNSRMRELAGKVKCIEQIVLDRLTLDSIDAIRSAICRQPTVDKVLFICCGCSSATSDLDAAVAGLSSYIRSLRSMAKQILCA